MSERRTTKTKRTTKTVRGGVAEATLGDRPVADAIDGANGAPVDGGEGGAAGGVRWDVPLSDVRKTRQRFVDNGGPVIERARVWLIFWGSAWEALRPEPDPSSDQITASFRQILDSPFLSRLHDYRPSIGYRYPSQNAVLGGTMTVRSELGTGATKSAADPPAAFKDQDVTNLVTNLITARFPRLPEPRDPNELYVVVTPADGAMANKSAKGEHYAADVLGWTAHLAWLKFGGMFRGDIDALTAIFSHELVEAITDPEGSAILGRANTCGNRKGWCEIGDVCENRFIRMPSGVVVQSYYSDTDGACIVPTAYPRPYRPIGP